MNSFEKNVYEKIYEPYLDFIGAISRGENCELTQLFAYGKINLR